MSGASYIFPFVVMLSVLIFVHELGHFLVAKACGVRVLKFSLGFGSPVGFGRWRMAWNRGDTEYVVAWVPLGGFVKMLGETGDPSDDQLAAAHPDETLGAKPVWQKLAIVFAGPAMNLALPVLVFALMLSVGLQRDAAVIGTVEAQSPAAAAGLEPGDRVVAIDGAPVDWWTDVAEVIRNRPGTELAIDYERAGEPRTTHLAVGERSALDAFGLSSSLGWAGVAHSRLRSMLAIPEADAPAALAGLRSGDVVTAVDGTPVEDWQGFAAAYAAAGSGPDVEIDIARRTEPTPIGEAPVEGEALAFSVPALGDTRALGAMPATVLIASTREGSPADRAGLLAGDLVLAVDGDLMGSFAAFSNRVKSSEGRTLDLLVSRDGRMLHQPVTPELAPLEYDLSSEDTYLVGVAVEQTALPGAITLDREPNPLVSVPRAAAMTWQLTTLMVQGVGKLVAGEVSHKQISGPVRIAEIAGKAMRIGWERYFEVMAFISINLGILNLLPIPVLDGGQAVIYSLEGIRRAPLSMRSREIFQSIGLTMIAMLIGLAFWNDLARHWDSFVRWVSG